MIILYTKPNNGYCDLARTFMIKNNVHFREYDLSKNRAKAKHWKGMGVGTLPIVFDDTESWVLAEWDQEIFQYLSKVKEVEDND